MLRASVTFVLSLDSNTAAELKPSYCQFASVGTLSYGSCSALWCTNSIIGAPERFLIALRRPDIELHHSVSHPGHQVMYLFFSQEWKDV